MKKLLLMTVLMVSAGLNAGYPPLPTPPPAGQIGNYAAALITYLQTIEPAWVQPENLKYLQALQTAVIKGNNQLAYSIFKYVSDTPSLADAFANFCAKSGQPVMRQMPVINAGNDSGYIVALLQYYLGLSPNSAITQAFVKLDNQDTYEALTCWLNFGRDAVSGNKAFDTLNNVGYLDYCRNGVVGYILLADAAPAFAQFAGDVKTVSV